MCINCIEMVCNMRVHAVGEKKGDCTCVIRTKLHLLVKVHTRGSSKSQISKHTQTTIFMSIVFQGVIITASYDQLIGHFPMSCTVTKNHVCAKMFCTIVRALAY